MIQKQRQRTIREILPKRLKLVVREWDNANGITTQKYRARIWSEGRKKYNFFTLDATNENTAITEALDLYSSLASSIEKNLPIGRDAKELSHYISMYMEYMDIRVKNGHITEKRRYVTGQLLKSLAAFVLEHGNPIITNLPDLYENKYADWRDKTIDRLRGTPLKPSTRNNETSTHLAFFAYLQRKEIVSRVPEGQKMEIKREIESFPHDVYPKLQRVMRREIATQNHPRIRWNWNCMRSLILLMYGTGCRVTEARNLRWTDIYIERNQPRIRFHGKKKERNINISPRVYGHLMDLLEFKKVFGKNWFNEEDYPVVFASYKMKDVPKFFDSAGRRKWYEECGLDPKKYPLVSFRHKFITDALTNGVPALQLAQYCGTSIHMLSMVYSHITPAHLYDQIFAPAPEQSLERKSAKWFDEMLRQKREKEDLLIKD
ncbi:MAG: site-specific integrase [Proteobacteria bacterium]|nr:site-specific integrase [Pseudomonadota bacterium]